MAASDVLHAVSRLVEGKRGGPLRQAAEHYDRASRPPRAAVPAATSTSRALRTAARGMLTARVAKHCDSDQLLQLLIQLASLAEAVARLRETQLQGARAAAARRAAEQLLSHTLRLAGAQPAGIGRDHRAHYPPDLIVGHAVAGWPPPTSAPGRHESPGQARRTR